MTDPYSKPVFLFLSLLLLIACNSNPNPSNNTASGPESTEVETQEPPASPEVEEPEETPTPPEEKADSPGETAPEIKEPPKEEIPQKTVPKKRPKISFTSKTYEYGVIMQGDKIEHEFRFKNEGDADLVIKNVTASCGCTIPTYPFAPIAPGEAGSIGVVFDSKGKLGRQKPTITVVSNARPGTHKLHLEGFVDAERAKEQVVKPDSTEETGEKEEGDLY